MKTFIFIFLLAAVSYSQEFKISGIIRDAGSGEPLPYANILIKDQSKGINSDLKGNYELTLSPGKYELLVSYISYKSETLPVEITDSDLELNVNLVSTDILLQEVSVYAATDKSSAVSSISMQSREMEEISSVFPDVFRSIQALPGVSVNNEFSAKYNVRGGNYDENLVLVNGTQVYEPFHIKEAENASVGIFNMDMMKKVNIITGGFSAEYGDRLSSVLNIEYREGNKERYSGAVSLSLSNFDGLFEGPLTSKGSFILGIRKSYLEYIISMIDYDEPVKPSFYDVQGVVTYNLSDINKLQFKFIHAGDDFKLFPGLTTSAFSSSYNSAQGRVNQSININEFEDDKANYYSNLFDLQSTAFISNDLLLSASLSYYWQIDREDFYYSELYRNDFTVGDYPGLSFFHNSLYEDIYDNELRIRTLEPKISLDIKLNPYYDIKTGFSYLNINYNQELIDKTAQDQKWNYTNFPDTSSLYTNNESNIFPQNIDANSYKLAGYMENIVQVSDRFIINAGGRFDYFDFNKDLTFSPRLSASFKFDDDINLRAAWGHYYQSPIYRQLAYSTPSDTNTQSQKAVHYILSLEKNFSFNNSILTLKAEGYYKKYSDLISTTGHPGGRIYYSRKNDSKGFAEGIDLYATFKLPSYYGWISYGLLTAKEDLLTDSLGEYPRFTDQTHTISFVNDFDLGKQWTLNIRFNYGSGFAYTPRVLRFDLQSNRNIWVDGEKNSDHLPPYKRIDLRVAKEFELFGLQTNLFLDVSNLFNFKNIYGYNYRYDGNGNPYREEVELWPIIPSLGLTVKL
ncbi:MAG TPA: TonB-dependent receptor [Ignavibacteriaceae bacterium]|nr:TonB-dependent receptor [Ignavibacteriaceae bacterium]